MTAAPKIRIEIHPKFRPLIDTPHTFASISGGRGGMKSEQVHKIALQDAISRPMRVCCARETMASIRDSSHKLLSDAIYKYGMGFSQNGPYEIQDSRILRREGGQIISEFIFIGIRENVRDQKSLKGVNRTIVEEAAKLSEDSLEVFVPTVVREEGSQLWFIWNPEFVDDPLYKMLTYRPPSNTIHIRTSYLENPWLSTTMRTLAEDCKRDFPEKYQHIWLGEPISSIEGAVYAAEISKAEAEGRICAVPYDTSAPVRTFWDLGWSDLVCIWFAQKIGFKYHLIDYHEDSFQSSDHYLQVLQRKGYTYSQGIENPAIIWPWDASTKMNRDSTEQSIRAKGFTLRILDQASKAGGIDAVRRLFPSFYFDAEKCAAGIAKLRRYQWGPATTTTGKLAKLQREPVHDVNSHAADALRTLASSIRELVIEESKPSQPSYQPRTYSPFG